MAPTTMAQGSDTQGLQKPEAFGTSREPSSKGVVVVTRRPSGVAVIALGHPGESPISLTRERLESLKRALIELTENPPVGLIISGTSETMFTVGADIGLIRDINDSVAGEVAAREGQQIFDLIAALSCKTVAAISGPCVGGGCEMVLACDSRIITDHPSSQIGLPEVSLGILPGFGGTQRLPRLVGLPKSLDIILAGKKLYPKQALQCGLVDAVVPFSGLLEAAELHVIGQVHYKRNKPPFMERILTLLPFTRSIVANKARASVLKKTGGHYPAPIAALDCVLYGLNHGMEKGLLHEAKELGRLIVTPQSKSLVHVYFLTEAARSLGKSARDEVKRLKCVVVGAGTMGAGIAAALIKKEHPVILKDTEPKALQAGKQQVEQSIRRNKHLASAQQSLLLDRLIVTQEDSPAITSSDIAIEAIVEKLEVKKQVFAALANRMADNAILATNTSSLSVTEIANAVPHPERVIGMHFFNPVGKMPLVEIVQGQQTSNRTICMVAALADRLGKYPIVVRDVPGFLVNRILSPYLNEAAFLLADGYAVADIDAAAKKFGMPMGPLRLLDEVGLDVAAHVAQIMIDGYGVRMQAPQYAAVMLEKGLLGKKGGKGFYLFGKDQEQENPEIGKLLGTGAVPVLHPNINEIQDRLILALLNEAVRCLDEGVAGIPGAEAAKQIDLGTVMGIGFPPFTGGLMRYAEGLGARAVHAKLKELEAKFGSRFSAAPGILQRAEQQQSFYDAVAPRNGAVGSE